MNVTQGNNSERLPATTEMEMSFYYLHGYLPPTISAIEEPDHTSCGNPEEAVEINEYAL